MHMGQGGQNEVKRGMRRRDGRRCSGRRSTLRLGCARKREKLLRLPGASLGGSTSIFRMRSVPGVTRSSDAPAVMGAKTQRRTKGSERAVGTR